MGDQTGFIENRHVLPCQKRGSAPFVIGFPGIRLTLRIDYEKIDRFFRCLGINEL